MTRKAYSFMFALTALIMFGSCKKEDSSSQTSAKTLNKSTFAPKTWYNKGGTIIHVFSNNGVYTNTGTWAWKNGSDTLEIATVKGGAKTYWKVYWNTEHEMNCKKVGNAAAEDYKDQLW